MPLRHIPRATYRLQLHAGFTFADAERIVPYLADLGVSHVYLSSFLKARPGSLHGYDVIDHNAFNPEVGSPADYDRLVARLAEHDMGVILDFVPNHMGVGSDNAWWLDVLEWGEASPHAATFDIDWNPPRGALSGKVLLPSLGDHYGKVLERGELKPKFDSDTGTVSVWYWDHRFPIAPWHYDKALGAVEELADILSVARELKPGRTASSVAARRDQADEMKRELAALVRQRPELRGGIDAALVRLGEDFSALHKLLEAQSYRVCYWRVAADEINYRRFFDINDLAGLRMENPDLFDRAHRLVFGLLRSGKIHGLRIDHIDGLYNPASYCLRLQEEAAKILGGQPEDQPLYLLVEKILAHFETVRRAWPVAGTTGYDFMNEVLGLFVDGTAADDFGHLYRRFVGREIDFEHEVYRAKKQIMESSMAAELTVLATRLLRIAESHWSSRDFTFLALRAAITEYVACFPVYRTYVTARRITDQDRRYIDWALSKARKVSEADPSIWDFLHGVLTGELGRAGGFNRAQVIDFAMKLQQYTGPVMAKGFEDTALYRYNRLIALNEVGGEPTRFGISPGSFHQNCRARLTARPHAMLATATHDAKRGEDLRVRIAVLSEMPDEWRARIERWSRLNQAFRRELDANDEYFLYQTLVGAWPTGEDPAAVDFVGRLQAAMTKSLREAKALSSWHHPNEAYEQAMGEFVARILENDRRNPFLDDFLPFQERVAQIGKVYGLAQTLLKLTCPGVPDIYQGTELWQLALVDPDNRRPVDYGLRQQMLADLRRGASPDIADGGVKLDLIRRILDLRRDDPELFELGDYQPLGVRGEYKANVLAFARSQAGRSLVVVVPHRLASRWTPSGPPLDASWRALSVELPGHAGAMWRNVLTGEDVVPQRKKGAGLLSGPDIFRRLPLCALYSTQVPSPGIAT